MDLDKALEHARAVGLSDAQIAVTVKAAADELRFRQLGGNVLMVNPALEGQEISVHPDTVEQHEAAGWTKVLDAYAALPNEVSTAGVADKPKTARSKS